MDETVLNDNGILDIFCSSCGAPAGYDIARQIYRCRYCGAETGVRETLERKNEFRRLVRKKIDDAKKTFRTESAKCTGCGAEIVFSENEALTDCAFCGRKLARREYTKTEDFPELLIPFKITQEEAKRRLLDWCAANSRRKEAKLIIKNADSLEGFYLPYILVKGPDNCEVRRENTSRIFRCRRYIDGMFVNLSDNLDNAVLDGMEPYDVGDLREFDFSFLAGHRVKIADLKDSDAEKRAADEIAADCEPYAAKTLQTRAITVTPDMEGMIKMSCVLPAYYLRAGDVTAAVNGQTGKVAVRECRDRFLLPWQLKPIAAVLVLAALSFLGSCLATKEPVGRVFLTGVLSMFFLVVVLTVYHDKYAGTKRFRLRRRILTSDGGRPPFEPPVFYERLDGEDKPVKLKFATPFRTLRMALLTSLVTFLPLVIGFIFNGFSVKGLTVGGAAVWLCIFVPLSPVFFLTFGRIDLYERPIIYTAGKRGKMRRYRKKLGPKRALASVKETVLNPVAVIAAIVALTVLIINVVLVLHWDDYGSDTDTAANEYLYTWSSEE